MHGTNLRAKNSDRSARAFGGSSGANKDMRRAKSTIHSSKPETRSAGKPAGTKPAWKPTAAQPKVSSGVQARTPLAKVWKAKPASIRPEPEEKENKGLQESKTISNFDSPGAFLDSRRSTRFSPARAGLAAWTATMEEQLDALTGQLEDIKRTSPRAANRRESSQPESSRPVLQVVNATPANAPVPAKQSKPAQRQILQTPVVTEELCLAACSSGSHDNKDWLNLEDCAKDLFDDPALLQLCQAGLTAQLQRTKHGATDKSRIEELAGLVKNLRRALKETQLRASTFRSASSRMLKAAKAEARSAVLASDSGSRQSEAEMAGLRRDVAQATAAHKRDLARWQVELDYYKAEAIHSRREMERVTAEKEKALSEARRAEASRIEMEDAIKGMKKETSQQLREVQVNCGEAVRGLKEAKEAHEQREIQFQEELISLQKQLHDTQEQSATNEARASSLQQDLWRRGEGLAATTQKNQMLEQDCRKLAAALSEHEQLHLEVVQQSSSTASEAAFLQQRCATLTEEAASKEAQLQAAHEKMAAQNKAFVSQEKALQQQLSNVKDAREAVQHRENALQLKAADLKAALEATQKGSLALEAQLKEAHTSNRKLQQEVAAQCAETEDAIKSAKDAINRVKALEMELIKTQGGLQKERDAREALAAEGSAKAARLARLEGEFEAMQEAIGTGSVDQAEMLGRLISRVASLDAAVAESHQARRALHNQLVHLRGNIRVFCRIKPHPAPVLVCLPDGTSVKAEAEGKEQTFAFDKVFGATASQQAVFDEVSELVQSALDGYQVCLFSYGQTGAGKTHTMQGGRASEAQGIIPRAVAKILEEASTLKEKGWEYELEATIVEVYNESLRDLLAEGKGKDVGKLPDANTIKHHPAGGPTTVLGAVRAKIATAEEAAALVKRAAAARAVEATAMNTASSRSHSVFMLHIKGHHPGSSTHLHGGLNLVDLAGSERLDKSLAEGQRQKEACSINKSLSALGDVFAALSAHNPHVPYRNSKLTHLLQPCLGGDGKTLMFVNVSPESASLHETLCSLRFASKVNACQTAAKGGARRHVSGSSDTRGSLQAGRQSVTQQVVGKRKAAASSSARTLKPRLK